jgi:hypothetical protein
MSDHPADNVLYLVQLRASAIEQKNKDTYTWMDPRHVLNLLDLIDKLEAGKCTHAAGVVEMAAALDDIKLWASKRCPCENDEPGICPLCDADVSKDRCMAVDVSFPKRIREQIDAALFRYRTGG